MTRVVHAPLGLDQFEHRTMPLEFQGSILDPSWEFDKYDLNCFTLGLGHIYGSQHAGSSNQFKIVHSALFKYIHCLRALSNHSLSTERHKLNRHERKETWFGQLEHERMALNENPSSEMKILLQFGAELLTDESVWDEGDDGVFRLQGSHPLPNGTFDAGWVWVLFGMYSQTF